MRRCEDEKMFYRAPLLEEPCAQTLSGKTSPWRKKTEPKIKAKKKLKNNFPEVLEMDQVTPESQNIFSGFSRGFLCFALFCYRGPLENWVYCFFGVFSSFCGLNEIDICQMISACFKEQMLVSIYGVSSNKVHFCDEHLHSSRISARFKGKLCNSNKVHSLGISKKCFSKVKYRFLLRSFFLNAPVHIAQEYS